MKFAPEYVAFVLNENFEDAKELLLSPLMAIHYAHLVMLHAQGIVSAADARTLRDALDGVSQDEIRRVKYDGTYEDLFFYIESLSRRVRRRGGGPVAHGALAQRHRHDDTGCGRGSSSSACWRRLAAPRAPRPRRPPPRHDLRRAHAHAAGAADDTALHARRRRTVGTRCPRLKAATIAPT
jgi:hypothetical protein